MTQQTDSFEFKDENARFGIKDEWINKPLHIGGQKQQTAVEWLAEQLPIRIVNSFQEEIAKAKQMEKEQIIKSFSIGNDCGYQFAQTEYAQQYNNGEQYYNETYGTEGR